MRYRLKPGEAASWRLPSEWEEEAPIEGIVEAFLNIHQNWWVDRQNTLYGRKEDSRAALIRSLKGEDTRAEYRDFGLGYVLDKIDNDFMYIFERF